MGPSGRIQAQTKRNPATQGTSHRYRSYSDDDVGLIFWGFGRYMGAPLHQNPQGDLLGHVYDHGRTYGQIDVRGYETNAYLPYHTDAGDMVGLLCLRRSLEGGLGSIVSSTTVHNEILARHPEYLGLLYNGYYYIRREAALTERGVSEHPILVFGYQEGVIRQRVARQPLAAQCLEGDAVCTADFPLYGTGALGGSESNHRVLSWLGWQEGATGSGIPGQGAKRAALGPVGRLLMPSTALPAEAPLGVHQVGGLLLVTLPGEFTTAMGRRVANGVAAAADWPSARVVLVGLANEYLSYFATPEEYSLQHYEGAATLWGPQAGPLLARRLAQLAATLPTAPLPTNPQGRAPTDFHHRPGLARLFTLAAAGPLAEPPLAGFESLLRDAEGRRLADPPTFCSDDAVPTMSAEARVTPRVAIVKASGPETFAPLLLDGIAENDDGVNFVTVAGLAPSSSSTAAPRSRWCTMWLGAPTAEPLHFQVQTLRGARVTSPAIPPAKRCYAAVAAGSALIC